jgi:Holliday junction resolvase-like predicted endonuclease
VIAAQLYLLRRFGQRAWPACRFDVLAFEAGEPRWIRSAFTPG